MPPFKAVLLHWDGKSWTQYTAPPIDRQMPLYGISVVASDDVWAVGGHSYEKIGPYSPMILHWDGTSWSAANPNHDVGTLVAVDFANAGEGWAVGNEDNTHALIEHYSNGTWNVEASPSTDLYQPHLSAVVASSPTDVTAVGYTYGALIEHSRGNGWEVVQSGAVAGSLFGVSTAPDGETLAVGSYGDSYVYPTSEALCPIQVSDSAISPRTTTVTRGSHVFWKVPEDVSGFHSVTDATAMDLYDSGILPPGGGFDFTFIGDGKYPYVDQPTGHLGSIIVPLSVTPLLGGLHTPFNLTLASASPPPGYVFDVQVRRPGSASFATVASGLTEPTTQYVPDGSTGTYLLRTRMRRARGGASGWTPPVAIDVHETAAEIAVGQTASPNPVAAETTLTLTASAINFGPDQALDVTLQDAIPASTTFVSASPARGTCNEADGTVTCVIGVIRPGKHVDVAINVVPHEAGTITNGASVTTTSADDSANNSGTIDVRVAPAGCTTIGTDGNDFLSGTSGPDDICGLDGDDRIVGYEGNDVIQGGYGRDVIDGGDGDDVLQGGPDNDKITGGPGNDQLTGDRGYDSLDGGADTDSCDVGLDGGTTVNCESSASRTGLQRF